jgi:hypothetical protein
LENRVGNELLEDRAPLEFNPKDAGPSSVNCYLSSVIQPFTHYRSKHYWVKMESWVGKFY